MDPDTDQDYAEFLKLLGMRIQQMRKERGLSLRDMVVKHNYHDSQWRRYERGGPMNVPSLWDFAFYSSRRTWRVSRRLCRGSQTYSQKETERKSARQRKKEGLNLFLHT
jgi:hypothetical protein